MDAVDARNHRLDRARPPRRLCATDGSLRVIRHHRPSCATGSAVSSSSAAAAATTVATTAAIAAAAVIAAAATTGAPTSGTVPTLA
eukprot:422444-Prymnesium_polylepis.1